VPTDDLCKRAMTFQWIQLPLVSRPFLVRVWKVTGNKGIGISDFCHNSRCRIITYNARKLYRLKPSIASARNCDMSVSSVILNTRLACAQHAPKDFFSFTRRSFLGVVKKQMDLGYLMIEEFKFDVPLRIFLV
jgi:hypothetical protein